MAFTVLKPRCCQGRVLEALEENPFLCLFQLLSGHSHSLAQGHLPSSKSSMSGQAPLMLPSV